MNWITGVHHVEIRVPTDQEAAARVFYCGVLGLVEIPKPDPGRERAGFWLKLANTEVHVSLEDGVDRTQTRAHIAYHVSDLTAMRAHLIQNGLQPTDASPIPGVSRFDCRDPFGNRMEFITASK